MRKSAITLKDIKASKKLTLSQKAILGEIHSLVSRGKEFYAWNSYLAEKSGIARSTAANAMTFFYKSDIFESKCERKDGKTARITKRVIKVNYNKLASFLDVPKKSQAYEKQPFHDPSKEKQVFVIKLFEEIDFTTSEKIIKSQWADYMVCWLDQETGRANAISKEKKAALGILNDAWKTLQYNIDGGTQYSEVDLIKDRRVEQAIKYGIQAMRKGIYKDFPHEDYVPVEDWNLTICYMRNIFPLWADILNRAMRANAIDGFTPQDNSEHDICSVYFSYEDIRYTDIEKIEAIIQEATEENMEDKIRELVECFPGIYPMPQTDYDKKIKGKIISDFRYEKNMDVRIGEKLDESNQEVQEITKEKISPIELLEKLHKECESLDDFTEEEKEAILKEEQEKEMQNYSGL